MRGPLENDSVNLESDASASKAIDQNDKLTNAKQSSVEKQNSVVWPTTNVVTTPDSVMLAELARGATIPPT